MYTNNMNSINDYEDNYKILMYKCVCICSLNSEIYLYLCKERLQILFKQFISRRHPNKK